MSTNAEIRNEAERCVKEIAKGWENLEKKLEKHVPDMCKIVLKVLVPLKRRAEGIPPSTEEHFKAIYWSLKLHLDFHLGFEFANWQPDLRKLGYSIGLTEEELKTLPQESHAVDPGSKFLEILADIAETPTVKRGSKEHADNIMEMARSFYKDLRNTNVFKPKVLALVSHRDQWFVGSSVAVSHFLRPRCLYHRISDFNDCLKHAIIMYNSLSALNQIEWKSEAFSYGNINNNRDDNNKKGYVKPKPCCNQCRKIFGQLQGFISQGSTVSTSENNTDRESDQQFLAACAEYCPVNQHFKANSYQTCYNYQYLLSQHFACQDRNCSLLFTELRTIVCECERALQNPKDYQNIIKVYKKIKPIVHFFGLKPKFNDRFGK